MRVLIDDMRNFVAPREDDVVLRTDDEAVTFLLSAASSWKRIDELWLDHDLGINPAQNRAMTIQPVVRLIESFARNDAPLNIGQIVINTSNPVGAQWMAAELEPHHNVRVLSYDERRDALVYQEPKW